MIQNCPLKKKNPIEKNSITSTFSFKFQSSFQTEYLRPSASKRISPAKCFRVFGILFLVAVFQKALFILFIRYLLFICLFYLFVEIS